MKQLDEMERMASNVAAIQEKYEPMFPSEQTAGDLARALLAVMPVVRASIAHDDVLLDSRSTVLDANRTESKLCAEVDKLRRRLGGE